MANGYGGGTNGGRGSGMPGGVPPGVGIGYPGGSSGGLGGNGITASPSFQKTKAISYGTSDQIYSATSTVTATDPSGIVPTAIELHNNGGVPLTILVGYETYSDETTDSGATKYLHIMLMPGEIYYPSVRAVISTEVATTQFDGTALENDAPASVMYIDSTAKTTEGFADDDDTTITFDNASGGSAGSMFKVNDLVRFDDEICRIVSLTYTVFTVDRAVHGTAKADHTNNTAIRLPFFNAYHDFDKYTVAQTDSDGKFKSTNFFGLGRTASGVKGIMPGSVAIKFYEAGYQGLGLSGITSSTNSGLTAGETLKLDITVDGGTLFQDLTFTLDSSNVNFGGTNGVISKIQSALDVQYYTAGNLFEKRVTVGIVDGDIRFTSGSHLSTSAILLADTGDSDTFIDAAANGRIPASGNIPAAVAAKLPDDVVYDKITYATTPNTSVFCYDDGYGKLFGACNGTINYETGAIDMMGCPPNAEFVYTVAHSSGFSGKVESGANAIVEILANTPSQKWDGRVSCKVW